MRGLRFRLVWFDSLGAKSACTLVESPETSILIDPGVAAMQPSFPASQTQKRLWAEKARTAIKDASRKAEIVVISHYHYDHFTDFDEELYSGRLILAKDPNEYVNDSQMRRAQRFYANLTRAFGGVELDELLRTRKRRSYPDPLSGLPLARSMDYGDYNQRKEELLRRGRRWFYKRTENWNSSKLIPELKFDNCEVMFADGREFRFGGTRLKFTNPLFHGIEYARVGWVISTVITRGDEKIIHSSDLEGPTIEDQAEWIIRESPDILILDGPGTYLIPFMLNLINLRRAVENTCRIIREAEPELIIYDHHLAREPRFKERMKKVYKTAEGRKTKIMTAAEYLGMTPAVLRSTACPGKYSKRRHEGKT